MICPNNACNLIYSKFWHIVKRRAETTAKQNLTQSSVVQMDVKMILQNINMCAIIWGLQLMQSDDPAATNEWERREKAKVWTLVTMLTNVQSQVAADWHALMDNCIRGIAVSQSAGNWYSIQSIITHILSAEMKTWYTWYKYKYGTLPEKL